MQFPTTKPQGRSYNYLKILAMIFVVFLLIAITILTIFHDSIPPLFNTGFTAALIYVFGTNGSFVDSIKNSFTK